MGLEWFKQGFVPCATARNKTGAPILLIYDGHGSHTTLEWIEHAREHNVHLFCLPPHTTHRLQPLDVGIFGPLQNAWFNQCDELLETTGEAMELRDVVTEYMKARRASFKPETILQAWRKSGIRPINPDIFKEKDYAPSYSHINTSASASFIPHEDASVFDASSDDELFDPSKQAAADTGSSDSEYVDILEGSETESEESDSDQNGEGSNGKQAHRMVRDGGSSREGEDQARLMAPPTMSAESRSMTLPICAPIPTTPARHGGSILCLLMNTSFLKHLKFR